MSRVYDAAEPGVISEDLLHKLVEEQGPVGEAGRIARKEGIAFSQVLSLRVDFKSQCIYKSTSEQHLNFKPINFRYSIYWEPMAIQSS